MPHLRTWRRVGPILKNSSFSDFGVMREPSGRIVTGTGLTIATIVSLSRCPKLRRIVITSAPQITDAALPLWRAAKSPGDLFRGL